MATTQVITAHVPIDIAHRVAEFSKQLERPRGWIVKQALTQWIEQEELKYQLTLEAIQEGIDGKTIDHQVVLDWANNLKHSSLNIPE